MTFESIAVWAYSYLRFSDPVQFKGDTLRRQNEGLSGWLKRNPTVQLDTKLTAWDKKAVSGFTAEHRTNPKYVLSQFTSHVDAGRVNPGSYLIVENLDRLTREHWTDAVPYVLALIAKGIRIVQLSPVEVIYDFQMDQGRLMMMLMELGRAHSESAMKSERVGKAWKRKKEAARRGVPHGRRVPAWIELEDGKYRLRTDAARAVRLIFEWSSEGWGTMKIRERLIRDSIEPISGAKWVRSYIAKILKNRAVVGEYQPRKGRQGHRAADGEPVPNYWPAAIDESLFYASQDAQSSRRGHCGRPGRGDKATSPFAGLLYCANDGSKLYSTTRKKRRYLISYAATNGDVGGCWAYFPLEHFVKGVLSQLQEVSAADMFGEPGNAQVEDLDRQIRLLDGKLTVAVRRFEANPESPTWADRIDEYERERNRLQAERQEIARAVANPVSATWNEAVELMRTEQPERLRQCLLQTVSELWAMFVPRGRGVRLAAVQVWFVGGGSRDYVILSKQPLGWNARQNEGVYSARSLLQEETGGFDLRIKEDAEAVARVLEAIDLTTF